MFNEYFPIFEFFVARNPIFGKAQFLITLTFQRSYHFYLFFELFLFPL